MLLKNQAISSNRTTKYPMDQGKHITKTIRTNQPATNQQTPKNAKVSTLKKILTIKKIYKVLY